MKKSWSKSKFKNVCTKADTCINSPLIQNGCTKWI